MLIFYFFAAIVIWLGALSLRNGLSFVRYVQRETARPLSGFTPFVSVIAPCRGMEDGLRENITALFHQDYAAFEIIFATDRADDPSLEVIEEIIEAGGRDRSVNTLIVIAGDAVDCGQKVHNLRIAVSKTDPRSEVFVFVDTDARPPRHWLRALVAPLSDRAMGATSGYRWFIPDRGGLPSHLRSVWNASIASALGEHKNKNFCWGGSTAIRKSTFAELRISERWRGTVSDDFTLTRLLQEAKLAIHFVPACLVPSLGDCSARELFGFTNRQLRITRVYAPHLWRPLLIGSFLFCAVFFGGVALAIVRAWLNRPNGLLLFILLLIYALGTAKAYLRLKAVAIPLSSYQRELMKSLPAHLLLWPITSALFLLNAVTAAFSRRIKWRGITYELKSATEAVIIAREP